MIDHTHHHSHLNDLHIHHHHLDPDLFLVIENLHLVHHVELVDHLHLVLVQLFSNPCFFHSKQMHFH